MRKCFALACALLSVWLLCGCALPPTDLDRYCFSPHLKPDVMAEDGKKAVLADDRIWYLSAESGQQGLHSMNVDGSDVQLEYATEDIRSLTIRDDTIWAAESIEDNRKRVRIFRLFMRDMHQAQDPIDVLNMLDETMREEVIYWMEDIWDFYLTGEGLFFRIPYLSGPDGEVLLADYYIDANGIVEESFSVGEKLKLPSMVGVKKWYKTYSLTISSTQEYIAIDGDCLFDYTADRPAFVISEPCFLVGGFPAFDLVYADEEGVYIANDEELKYVKLQPAKMILLAQFPEGEKIASFYSEGDTHLLLTRHEEIKYRTILPDKIRSDKRLYRIDLETGAREQMLSVEHPAEFVYLSDRYTATAEGKTLMLYAISGETVEKIREIELEHEIVDKANKTDCAGGWWFLYRFNEETNRDELIEKVRLY